MKNADIYLWDTNRLSEKTDTSCNREKNVTVYKMSTEEENAASNFDDAEEGYDGLLKCQNLKIDDHTSMSLMAGLLEPPSGSAWNYVVDRANWAVEPFGRGSEVAVHCRSSSKKISVDPTSQLDIDCRLERLIQNKASHVVVAVSYGLEAFCIFSKNLIVGKEESVRRMEDYAKFFADELLKGKNRLDDGDLAPMDFHCILYSDLMPDWTSHPVTKQYEICRKVLDHVENKAIPLEVWLYPIRKLTGFREHMTRMPSIRMENSPYLMFRCQLMLDRLQRVRFKSESLIENLLNTQKNSIIKCWNLPVLYQRIQQFQKCIEKFQGKLLNALSHWLVSIRRGEESNEDQMVELLATIENKSPFIFADLVHWIDYQKQQINILEKITKLLPSVKHLSGAQQVLDREIHNQDENSFAVVLHLPRLIEQLDHFVQEMVRYVDGFDAIQPSSWTGKKRKEFGKPIDCRLFFKAGKEFSNWVTNSKSETIGVQYVIFYDEQIGKKPFVKRYVCRTHDSMVIRVPKAPGQVRVEVNDRGVVTLSWETEETAFIIGYLFQYRNVNHQINDPWTSIEHHPVNKISMNHLQSEESYLFRVAAVTPWGRSSFGPVSDEIIIDPIYPPPIETDDQVRAVYMDARGRYAFDSPACPILEVKTQRVAERPAEVLVRRGDLEHLISESNQNIFKLPLEKDARDNMTPGITYKHYIFREPNFVALVDKPQQRTILLMGASGSGKSTLINAMANYILGVKWDDNFRFKLIDEPANKTQAHSQTENVTTYDLYHMVGFPFEYSLTVVDTPGFGDTRGIERDQTIMDQIQDYFNKGIIQHLDAVCFVIESFLPRLTDTQQYIFDSILSIFGNDIKDSIRLMVTFADTKKDEPPVLAAITEAGIPSPLDQATGLLLHHKFKSSIFFDSEQLEIDKMYFDMSVQSFERFFADLSGMETKSLEKTREVIKERMQLQVLVESLQTRMELKLARASELERIDKNLSESKEQQTESNKDLEFEVLILKSASITGTDQFSTNCPSCKMICHFPCQNGKNKTKCSFMCSNDGRCRICNCPSQVHSGNQRCRYELVKEKMSLDSIRQQYQETASAALTNEELLDKIKNDIVRYEKQYQQLMKATPPHIQRLDEIALRPRSFSTIEYIDLMIETEKENIKPDSEKRRARLLKLRKNAELKKVVELNYPLEPKRDN